MIEMAALVAEMNGNGVRRFKLGGDASISVGPAYRSSRVIFSWR